MSSEELDRFFSQGAPAPDRVNGRYQWPDPVTGSDRSWQTASNYAYPIVDHWALDRWRTRQLLVGLGRRTDLLAVLAAMVEPDNGKLDEVAKTALEVAGVTEKANMGTAVHSALEAADLGQAWPDMFDPHVAAYRAEIQAAGLRPVAVEQQVINRDLGAAGKFDRIYEEADGTYVLGDVKTSGRLDLGALEHAVQFAVYQGSSHVRTPNGEWVPMPALRRDYAVLVHVGAETGATSVYRVSLRIGRLGANLAEEVRGLRKMGPILLPYVAPESVPVTTEVAGATRDPYASGGSMPPVGTQPADAIPVSFPAPHAEQNTTEPSSSFLEAAREEVEQLNEQTRAVVQNAVAHLQLRSADDLLRQKVSKGEVQEYARKVDPEGVGRDLAHNKKVLVELLGKRGKLAAAGSTSPSTSVPPASAPLPGSQPAAPPSETPGSNVFRELQLGRIKAAATVGDLQVLNRAIVTKHGDQAWTDEFTEAARLKVAELDAAAGGVDPTVAQRIYDAADSKELSKIWEDVTIGGSDQKRWEPYAELGKQRLADINNARPPAPANPFAGS